MDDKSESWFQEVGPEIIELHTKMMKHLDQKHPSSDENAKELACLHFWNKSGHILKSHDSPPKWMVPNNEASRLPSWAETGLLHVSLENFPKYNNNDDFRTLVYGFIRDLDIAGFERRNDVSLY